jgi:6-phosphofructokinase 1
VTPVTLDQLTDPATGRIRVRLVDATTESYDVARKYMIRLEPADLTEPRLSRLSAQTSLTSDQFVARFAATVGRQLQGAAAG